MLCIIYQKHPCDYRFRNLLMCRFFEPDAVHKDEKVEKNRIAADYTRVRAS